HPDHLRAGGGDRVSLQTSYPVAPRHKGKLAINVLKASGPLDAAKVDDFLARHQVPIVEGPKCTFLFRGDVDAVAVRHRIVNQPQHVPMRRLEGTDLWYVTIELPAQSRVEYQV